MVRGDAVSGQIWSEGGGEGMRSVVRYGQREGERRDTVSGQIWSVVRYDQRSEGEGMRSVVRASKGGGIRSEGEGGHWSDVVDGQSLRGIRYTVSSLREKGCGLQWSEIRSVSRLRRDGSTGRDTLRRDWGAWVSRKNC